jgi:hypothetical protein
MTTLRKDSAEAPATETAPCTAPESRRGVKLVAPVMGIVLFSFCVIGTTILAQKKHDAIGYHPIDYPFYLQFQVRAFNEDYTQRYSFNPRGFNWLGLGGLEGKTGLHGTIHLEPIKYLLLPLYRLTHKTWVLFLVFTGLFFLPMLYITLITRQTGLLSGGFVVLFCSAFAFFPGTLPSVLNDFRPMMLMGSMICLAFAAIQYDRPFYERFGAFILLLSVREEAVVVAPAVIMYAIVHLWQRGAIPGKSRVGDLVEIGILSIVWTAYAIFNVAYYQCAPLSYTDEPFYLKSYDLLNVVMLYEPIFISVVAVVIVLLWYGAKYAILGRFVNHIAMILKISMVGVAAMPFIMTFLEWSKVGNRYGDFITNPRWSVIFYTMLALLAVIFGAIQSKIIRIAVVSCLIVLTVCGLANAGRPTRFVPLMFAGFREKAELTAALDSLREQLDPLKTVVLCDCRTLGVFYDYEKVYAFDRLPYEHLHNLAGSDEEQQKRLFFPQNTELLKPLMPSVEYVFVESGHWSSIKQLLVDCGRGDNIDSVRPMAGFVISHVRI